MKTKHHLACRPLLVVGTRPEGIKMAPVIRHCLARPDVEPIVCFTGQHQQMLAQVADYFEIVPNIDLGLMKPNQSLSSLTARCLQSLDEVIETESPDCVVAQGDTTTVLAASMAAFFRQVPFVHVEAGLRTGDLYSPWPEEFNRRAAGITAAIHCAPTQAAAENLRRDNVAESAICVTGNTVIDALLWTVDRERTNADDWQEKYNFLGDGEVVLITGHRRENFGLKLNAVCSAIAELAARFPKTEWIYPVHLNPNVKGPVHDLLGTASNVHLTAPASYPEFVWLMDRSKIIITDSGGVQEEAPSLKKPVLVTRDTTERPEAVHAGAVQLVGADQTTIVETASRLMLDEHEYAKWQIDDNPYGDGNAASQVVEALLSVKQNQSRAA